MVSGLKPYARQGPKMDASIILVPVPCYERIPPLILGLIASDRSCARRSASSGFSGGTSGWTTKTKISLMWFSARRHSLAWADVGSSR